MKRVKNHVVEVVVPQQDAKGTDGQKSIDRVPVIDPLSMQVVTGWSSTLALHLR